MAGTRGHEDHARLPRSAPDAAWLGTLPSSRGGRAVYERKQRARRKETYLDELLCPAFTAATARAALDELRSRRGELFPAEAAGA